jgi:hypothetical protein
MDYHKKYLKYKRKFLNLIKIGGGGNENINFLLNFNKIRTSIIEKYENFSFFFIKQYWGRGSTRTFEF